MVMAIERVTATATSMLQISGPVAIGHGLEN